MHATPIVFLTGAIEVDLRLMIVSGGNSAIETQWYRFENPLELAQSVRNEAVLGKPGIAQHRFSAG